MPKKDELILDCSCTSGQNYSMYYTAGLDNEYFISFFSTLSSILTESQNNTIDLYFCSDGGYSYCSDTLIHIINKNKDRIKLLIVAGAQSAGWDVFYYSKCKIELLPFAYGVLHKGILSTDQREMEMNKNKKHFMQAFLKEQNIKALEDFKWFLTKEEISDFKNYQDVYISRERMLNIVKEKHRYLR